MTKRTVSVLAFLVLAFSITMSYATQHNAEERGKAHFNNPTFAAARNPASTCHPEGRGLEGAGAKAKFSIMGGEQNSLEEAINVCIVNANKGKALDVNSSEMQELTSYIKSLKTQ